MNIYYVLWRSEPVKVRAPEANQTVRQDITTKLIQTIQISEQNFV